MLHHLQHIVDLVEICRLKGIKNVVISPGSRNAALIHLFSKEIDFKLHGIVDERSAAFFALGIALSTKQPVALVSTSGTAVVNYAPALAEAYYQRIPLIAITADRPEALIDQQDNQTIRQQNIFQNFIKASIHLSQPLMSVSEQLKQVDSIDKTINQAISGIKGPIHINVPIDEPFYIEMPAKKSHYNTSEPTPLTSTAINNLTAAYKTASKKMILCGQGLPNSELNSAIQKIALNKDVITIAEPISNIKGERIIQHPDPFFWNLQHTNDPNFTPDLLISFGGPIVSKQLKIWLQKHPNIKHFRISNAPDNINTYHNLTENIVGSATEIVTELSKLESNQTDYYRTWNHKKTEISNIHHEFTSNLAYSDFKVYSEIMRQIPNQAVVHFGNSAPVRYAQLFECSTFTACHSNRGVSGIDGCVSTAAGFSTISKQLNVLLVGDLSFLYDSNAMWNKYFPKNLRIIVVHNDGGGIFSMIPGPEQQPGFDEYMQAHHPVNFEFLIKAYGLKFYECSNETELSQQLPVFFNSASASVLVVHTPKTTNAPIYKKYIQQFKA